MEDGVLSATLTDRQKEILQLIVQDLSAKEIGMRLGISSKTVECHKYLITRKLGSTGTAGLVRYAIRNALVDP